VPFVNRMTFSKSAILQGFPNFYILRVDIFRNFFRLSVRMTPMNHEKFHGKHVCSNIVIWATLTICLLCLFTFFPKSGTQTHRRTDRRGNFIYIDDGCVNVSPSVAVDVN